MSALDAVTFSQPPADIAPLEHGQDMSYLSYRNGRIKAVLKFAHSDYLWLQERHQIAIMALNAATKRFLVDRSAEALEQLEAALQKQRDFGSRLGHSISQVENVLEELAAGEAEEERRKRAYTRSIVEDAKRKPVRGPGSVSPEAMVAQASDTLALSATLERMPSRTADKLPSLSRG